MTTETTGTTVSDPSVGATTDMPIAWHQINWRQAERNVRRLQTRIAQATQAGKWGKVRALQHLLTHSLSGKALAVRRVTENTGKRTSGVDGAIWKTPEQKAEAIRKDIWKEQELMVMRERVEHPCPPSLPPLEKVVAKEGRSQHPGRDHPRTSAGSASASVYRTGS